MRRFDEVADIALCHSNFERTISCFIGRQSDLRCQTHQFDFVGTLDHAASGRNWSRSGESRAGRSFFQAVAEDKLHRLLDADGGVRNSSIAESLGHTCVGALVFLPDAQIEVRFAACGRLRDLLTRAAFLKRWRDVERISLGGQDHRKEAFSTLPSYAGKV